MMAVVADRVSSRDGAGKRRPRSRVHGLSIPNDLYEDIKLRVDAIGSGATVSGWIREAIKEKLERE